MTLYIVTSEWDLGLSVYNGNVGFASSFQKVYQLAKTAIENNFILEENQTFDDLIKSGLISFSTEEI